MNARIRAFFQARFLPQKSVTTGPCVLVSVDKTINEFPIAPRAGLKPNSTNAALYPGDFNAIIG